MKKRRILILFAAVVLSAGFFLYHRLRSVRAPEFVLSYAENQTEDYPTTLGAKKFAELVEEYSGGNITADVLQTKDVNGNVQPVKSDERTRRIDGTAALLDAYVVYCNKRDEFESLI